MTIRKTTASDFAKVTQIYADAREYMRENGNPTQWSDWYPPRDMIERDIQSGTSYVCVDDSGVAAVFYFNIERDPTYEHIDGEWLNDEPCGVVHRIAKRLDVKGAGEFCVNWCFEQCRNLKIDTHKDNLPMQKLLSKLGFVYCGIIWVLDGEERVAFQKTAVA
ncbi:MAG: GNAT family N-acetyltransferase [Oscillospiraceae bacterium]|jgi:hypothetical protein|nr:GNAT family N-acetyltransferase [Oscillospiraceae bacterium]